MMRSKHKIFQLKNTRYRGLFPPGAVFQTPRKVTKKQFVEALHGSAGSKPYLAHALGVGIRTIYKILRNPSWMDVQERYNEECLTAADIAEDGLLYTARQSFDLSSKLKACLAILKYRKPMEYGDNSKLTIEGGQNPIRTENLNAHMFFDPDTLEGLSIEAKRELLTLAEKQQAKLLENTPQGLMQQVVQRRAMQAQALTVDNVEENGDD